MRRLRTLSGSIDDFILTDCYVSTGSRCGIGELYEAYEAFCANSRDPENSKDPSTRPLTRDAFSQVLETNGDQKKRSGPTGCYEWHGLAPMNVER